MKKFYALSILLIFLCCSFFVKAQTCAVKAGYKTKLISSSEFVYQFTDTSTIPSGWMISNVLWKFGDSTTSTDVNPYHHFAHTGIFNVCHYVRAEQIGGTGYCYDSICHTVAVCNAQALFIHFPNGFNAGQEKYAVSFSGGFVSLPTNHHWTFQNGTPATSTADTPIVTYTKDGNYLACLTLSDQNGCTASLCRTTTVGHDNFCSAIHIDPAFHIQGSYLSILADTSYANPDMTEYSYTMDGNTIPGDFYSTSVDNITPGNHTFCIYVYPDINKPSCSSFCKTLTFNSCNGVLARPYFKTEGESVVLTDTLHRNTQVVYYYSWSMDGKSLGLPTVNNSFTVTNVSAGSHTFCESIYTGSATTQPCNSLCETIIVNGKCTADASWTYTQYKGTVQFSGVTNSTNAHILWSFGDGTTSTDVNPSHTYLKSSTYHVCHFIYFASTNCIDSSCNDIVVNLPTPDCVAINIYPYVYVNGSTVFIGDSVANPIGTLYSFSMDGKSLTSRITSPTYTINSVSDGTHRICAYAYSGTSTPPCDSVCMTATVNSCYGMSASFTERDTAGNVYLSAAYNPATTIYTWTMDGKAITPPLSGIKSGNHVFCLKVRAATTVGYCDSLCKTINVGGNNCGVSAQWTSVNNGLGVIKFTGAKNPTGVHTPWSFGDGTTSSDASPTHTYTQSGTYRVCHYVYMPGTDCIDSLCNNITITPCDRITASIYISVHDSANYVYLYSNTTNPAGTVYTWYIDGNIVVNGSTNAYYSTSNLSAGTHLVCEYVYSGNNSHIFCDSACETFYFKGNGGGNPCNVNAAWTSTETGATVQFTGVTNPAGVHTPWSFGDGTTSSDANVTHTYTKSGTYHVCHYVYLPNTTCIDSVCNNIVVTTHCNASAAFTSTPITGGGVQFFGVSGNTTNDIRWWFGDGSTSSDANPTHYYTHTGTYLVCHQVHGTNCIDSLCNEIKVTNVSPCNGIKSSFLYSVSGTTVVLQSNASNPSGTLYKWIEDGKVLADANANTAYTAANVAAGTHHFCLVVYSSNSTASGCDTSCQTIVISNAACHLSAQWTSAGATGGIQFTPATNPAGTYYYWRFGDGSTSSSVDPKHYYAKSGYYKVCLVVYQSSTCIDSFCNTIHVINASPCAGVTAGFAFSVTGNAVALENNITNNPTGTLYQWTLDGKALTSPGTGFGYTATGVAAGVHTFCLYVYGPNSATPCDSTCKAITVTSGTCNVNAQWTSHIISGGGVQFTGAVNPSNAHTGWSFGDGSTSGDANPTHTYTAPGIYHVCHYVYIPASTCIDSVCSSITIASNTTCKTYFSDTTNANSTGVSFHSYVGLVPGDSIHSYTWSFGDGTSSHDANPTHTYNVPGNYSVCLTTLTTKGCTSTFCDSVYAGSKAGSCQSDFSYTVQHCNVVSFTNNSTGNYTSQLWYYGDGSSSNDASPTHTFTKPGTYTVYLRIANTATGCLSYSYQVITIQSCVSNDTICGIVFGDSNGDGVLDSAETGLGHAEIHIDNTTIHSDSTGHYFTVVSHASHYIYIVPPTGCLITLPFGPSPNGGTSASGVYYIPAGSNNNLCGYNFGIDCNVVHVCGTVYFDANNNGVKDNSENGVPSVTITITGGGKTHHAYTDANGNYCETLPAGTYVITSSNSVYKTCTSSPGAITLQATVSGQTYNDNNFAVFCPPGACDLSLKITPYTTVTAGFPALYSLYACNVGTNVSSGTITLLYDPAVHFKYAYPVPASVDSSSHIITWSVSNLFPGACQAFVVYFSANVPLTIGQHVFTFGNIMADNSCTDANLTNNVDTLHQEVTGSWDPNNKLAYLTNYNNPAYQVISSLDANQRIEYVINFQNTGNAPAYNIVVIDTLTSDLDLESFEFLGSSHPCTVIRNGNMLNFNFSNIMLPGKVTDEPGSHGFVKFALNAVNGLHAGHIITDPAEIYFDYNNPVRTNDAAVQLLDVTGAGTIVNNTTVLVAPNPMTDYTIISLKSANNDGFRLRVVDITGRFITEQTSLNNSVQFNRNSLPAGLYLYEIVQSNKSVARGKLIIQ